MKIDSSSIGMGSQHASARRVSVEESLRAWVGLKRPDFEHTAAPNRAPGLVMPPGLAMLSTRVTISNSARQAAASAAPPADAQAAEQVTDAMDEARHDPKIRNFSKNSGKSCKSGKFLALLADDFSSSYR